jgi:hypothetical protein
MGLDKIKFLFPTKSSENEIGLRADKSGKNIKLRQQKKNWKI